MKKTILFLPLLAVVACGPNAAEIEATVKADLKRQQDSIANVEKIKADAIASFQNQQTQESNTPIAEDTVKKKTETPKYDFTNVKVGERFMGGLVIKKKPTEILIASPKPIGSGGWNDAKKLAARFKLGEFKWRLPSPAELELIFSMRNLLDSYEQNWYWTNNTQGNKAEHIGINQGDHAFVPKEHGKFIFVVSAIKAN
jgi:hypothetical protein